MLKRTITIVFGLFLFGCGSSETSLELYTEPSILLPIPSFSTAEGADLNGYTALYEKRAGNSSGPCGAACDVDVTTLVAQSCNQIVETATAWGDITWSNTVICLRAGDHTSKGTLTTGQDGTSGTRKILRCVTSGGAACSNPWSTAEGNRAKIAGFSSSSDYWIISRVWITGYTPNFGSYVIYDSVLKENSNFHGDDGFNVTIQNSVCRNMDIAGLGAPCADSLDADFHVVNNEIYNFSSDGIQLTNNSNPTRVVIENNDIYITSAYQTSGNGVPGSGTTHACSENGLDLKELGTTSANHVKVIHNRIWGTRLTDSGCSDGSFGEAIIFHSDGSSIRPYGLIQNNIIMDVPLCVATPNAVPNNTNVSFIGNICYNVIGVPTGTTWAMDQDGSSYNEWYLNTFIKTAEGNSGGWADFGGSNQDTRCNVIIDGGAPSGTPDQADHNVYYNTTAAGETNKIEKSITTRANSTSYASGSVIRTSSLNGFLYIKSDTGTETSGGSEPTWCTVLGCTVADGDVTWKAIRGPYTFFRKLKTTPGGEAVTIPYVRVHIDAPEANPAFCPSGFASRTEIGIDDSQP